MGFFTKFKPMSAWTNDELMDERMKITNHELGLSTDDRSKIYAKLSEFDVELKKRGLNPVDEINKYFDALARKR